MKAKNIFFNLEELKKRKNVDYQQISYDCRIRYQHILDIKNNKVKRITLSQIKAILDYFECDITDLIKYC